MPSTYHDFDPWRRAAENISQGLIAAQQARANAAMRQQEMQMRAPLLAAQTGAEQAQADHYRAQTGKVNQEVKFAGDKQKFLQSIMPDIEKGTMVNPDGSTTLSPEATKRMAGAIAFLAKDSSDLGSGFENFTQGANWNFNAKQERKNKRRMNQDDNAALLGRAELGAEAAGERNAASIASREKIAGQSQGVKSSGVDTMRASALKSAYASIYSKLADVAPGSKQEKRLQEKLAEIEAKMEKLAPAQNNRLTPPAPSGNSGATPAAAPAAAEVRRQTKDGRIAVFDANTKQFLRYAE